MIQEKATCWKCEEEIWKKDEEKFCPYCGYELGSENSYLDIIDFVHEVIDENKNKDLDKINQICERRLEEITGVPFKVKTIDTGYAGIYPEEILIRKKR